MTRARLTLVATLLGACFSAGTVLAQSNPDPLSTPILAGKKFTPPIKGLADVDYTKPVTKRDKDKVVTTIEVRNASNAPIPRLQIDETWYDDKGNTIPGGKGIINGLLQPGEIQTVKIETPYNPKMRSNNWNFSHAQGTVKPHLVKSLGDTTKEPATKKASTTKKK